jgi:hypothetical protein
MKETTCDKTDRRPTTIKFWGITAVALLILLSIIATADTVAAAETEFKDYVPQYNCADINIKNAVGSDIVVSWAPVDSKKSIFQVNIPKGMTHEVSAPEGSYDQYVHFDGQWYKVLDETNKKAQTVFVQCGYIYSYELVLKNTVTYKAGFKQIPDSEAPKI